MSKFAINAILSLLLIAVTGGAFANTPADLENRVTKLQQEKAHLLQRLDRVIANSKSYENELGEVTADRAFVRTRLDRVLTNSKELGNELEKVTADRAFVRTRLDRVLTNSKELENELEKVTADRAFVRTRLDRVLTNSKELGNELDKVTADRAFVRTRLDRVLTNSKELDNELEKVTADRAFVRTRLDRVLKNSKELDSELEKVSADRAFVRTRLDRVLTNSKQLENELDKVTADRAFARTRLQRVLDISRENESKLADNLNAGANWASTTSSSLDAKIGGLSGTTIVTTSDNKVLVQVGNTGLFRTSGTSLSSTGIALLTTIAQDLANQDANITVVGHTDNIPVGNGSAFNDNEELSFARAASTLRFLSSQGIPNENISAAGYGADYPIASNATEEGRKQNRRVDIVLEQR